MEILKEMYKKVTIDNLKNKVKKTEDNILRMRKTKENYLLRIRRIERELGLVEEI